MNSQDFQHQEKLQDAAARAEREQLPSGDPQVDAYRLIWRALKQPLPVSLPADFAQQVARKLQARYDRLCTRDVVGVDAESELA